MHWLNEWMDERVSEYLKLWVNVWAMSLSITVYPKKYAHGFVVLCFVVVMQSFIMNSHEVFIHIHQGCFAGTGAIVRLPQCQWSKPDGYGKISQCITTTKHSKAKTVSIFLGIYCSYLTWLSKCWKFGCERMSEWVCEQFGGRYESNILWSLWNESRWCHEMETFSALLVSCAGNSPVTGKFPLHRPVTQSFDVFFICARWNGWASNGDDGDLRRHRDHYDVTVMTLCWGKFQLFFVVRNHFKLESNFKTGGFSCCYSKSTFNQLNSPNDQHTHCR